MKWVSQSIVHRTTTGVVRHIYAYMFVCMADVYSYILVDLDVCYYRHVCFRMCICMYAVHAFGVLYSLKRLSK